MIEKSRAVADIERSLGGTRRRIDDDLDELSRRIHSRANSIPDWARFASIAVALFVVRRPLFKLVQVVASLSAPVVVPLVIGRIMERRSQDEEVFQSGLLGEPLYGEQALGDGRAFGDATGF